MTFTARERDLLREHTFADPVYADRIKGAEGGGVARSSPSELDDILGYLAAAANHTRSRKLQDELDVLYDPLEILVEAEGVHSRDEF